MTSAPDTVARLMAEFRKGDRAAADRLVELLYPELRKLAAAKDARRAHPAQLATHPAGERALPDAGQNQGPRR